MKHKLTDNIALKILSVVVAVVVWVVVVNFNDSVATERYTLAVAMKNTNVITDNGKVFRVEDGSDTVRLTVRARHSVLREVSAADFTLTADMEKDLKYDSLVGITVECKNRDISIEDDVSLSRSNVKVSIEESATEHFPVTVRAVGTKNTGLEIGSMVPEQTIIKISGPVSIVERIKRVEAEVDVTGLPATSVKTCKLKILDGNNEEMDTAYLNYSGKNEGMDVTITMLNTKVLPLNFDYEGTPAENYHVSAVTSKPEMVTVAGSAGVLAGLRSLDIPASAINVDGIETSRQIIVKLTDYLPEGVLLSDENDESVLVTVETEYVEPEETTDGEDEPSDGENGNDVTPEKPQKPDGEKPNTEKPDTGGDKEEAPSKPQSPSKPEEPPQSESGEVSSDINN